MVQIHPRYYKVTQARLEWYGQVLKAEEKEDLSIGQLLEFFLTIALETNKVDKVADRKTPDFDAVMAGLYKALVAVEKTYELTPAETIKIMLEVAQDTNKYAIRLDRHPDDPDKKGDEA